MKTEKLEKDQIQNKMENKKESNLRKYISRNITPIVLGGLTTVIVAATALSSFGPTIHLVGKIESTKMNGGRFESMIVESPGTNYFADTNNRRVVDTSAMSYKNLQEGENYHFVLVNPIISGTYMRSATPDTTKN